MVRFQAGLLKSWPDILGGGRRLWRTWLLLHTIFEKSAWSACWQISDTGIWELGKNPDLTALLMIDCSRCLSEASVNPHQSGDAYDNLLTSVAWVTSQRALPLSPWDLKTLRAKDVWAHLLTKLSIWGLNDKWSWMVTPRTTNWLTLCIPELFVNRW